MQTHDPGPEPKHCDDYIDDPHAPEALRAFLAWARSPSHGHLVPKPWPVLFATYQGPGPLADGAIQVGMRVRVVMASRLGDVGITRDLAGGRGYEARVHVDRLWQFSAES